MTTHRFALLLISLPPLVYQNEKFLFYFSSEMSIDIEQERTPLNSSVTNPYQANDSSHTAAASRALARLQRLMYLCLSLFGLHKLQFYQTIFVSSRIRHVPFQWGLALTIGT